MRTGRINQAAEVFALLPAYRPTTCDSAIRDRNQTGGRLRRRGCFAPARARQGWAGCGRVWGGGGAVGSFCAGAVVGRFGTVWHRLARVGGTVDAWIGGRGIARATRSRGRGRGGAGWRA